jgi:hypothetical protein
VPKVTSKVILPSGCVVGCVVPAFSMSTSLAEMRLSPAHPSTSILQMTMFLIVGATTNGQSPTLAVRSGWSSASKVMGTCDQRSGQPWRRPLHGCKKHLLPPRSLDQHPHPLLSAGWLLAQAALGCRALVASSPSSTTAGILHVASTSPHQL